MIRKLSLALLAAVPALMHAEDYCMPEYTPGEPLCDQCAGYTQYAGVQLNCGWDVFAMGEFLYWRPLGALNWVAEALPADLSSQTGLSFKHGYKPGFRVGIGMVAHCFDDWIFSVDYLRYHASSSQTMREESPNVLTSTAMIFPGVLATSIKNSGHFHYDIVGLNIQRPNYLGQRVILSPSLGLKWLKREVTFNQDILATPGFGGGLNTGRSVLKYTSIGIAAGFEGSWLLCWGLSLIGNADVALLYPYQRSWRQVVTPAVISNASPVVTTQQHFRHLDIYGKGGIGLGWGSYFCCNRYHFNVAATYDFMGDVVKMDGHIGMQSNGSIVLMGLTVRGQFDF